MVFLPRLLAALSLFTLATAYPHKLSTRAVPGTWQALYETSKAYRLERAGRIERGSVQGRCSISYDDGPYIHEQNIVDQIHQAGWNTTFFVNGFNWGCIYDEENVKRLKYAYEHGNQICSHTWSHPHMSALSDSDILKQVDLVEVALVKILGIVPTCLRPPYGDITDHQVQMLNQQRNLQVILWNKDTKDADGATVDYSIGEYKKIKYPENLVILNHETLKTTAENVTPEAIRILKQKQYTTCETVSNNVGFRPYKIVGSYGVRDSSWTCEGTPAPGDS